MTRSFLEIEASPSSDPAEYLKAALQWHFSRETGAPFWLEIAESLDFDPVNDIETFADLDRFPDVARDLRDRSIEELLPKGLAGRAPPSIFETGGTTGAPKRLIYTRQWIQRCLEWKTQELIDAGFPKGKPWLVAMPSGPHAFGYTSRLQAEALGSVLHTIDVDPRWVKKLISAGASPDPYVEHIVTQIRHIAESQAIGAITTTPPILAAIVLDERLTDLLRKTVTYIALAGARLDDDTYELIAEAFPDVAIKNVYGSTMVLTTAKLRDPTAAPSAAIYDGYPPYVVFAVVDPDTGAPVAYGERGQVRMSHISSGVFIPNNLERDTAIRLPAPDGGVGDALSSPRPLETFDGETVVPGVY